MRELKESKNILRDKTYIIFFDTETLRDKENDLECDKFLLAVCKIYRIENSEFKEVKKFIRITDNSFLYFFDVEDFKKFISECKNTSYNIIFFAHNLQYDLQTIFTENEIRQLNCIINNNCVIAHDKNITFIDTMNYFDTSVEKMSNFTKAKKIHIDFDKLPTLKEFKKLPITEKQKIYDIMLQRCKNDVEILSEYFINFVNKLKEVCKKNNVKFIFSYTISSTAYSILLNFLKKNKIKLYHYKLDEELLNECYRGGLTNVKKLGKVNEKLYYLDVNSMYPYVMKTRLYPTELILPIENTKGNEFISLIEKLREKQEIVYIADCEIDVKNTTVLVRDITKKTFEVTGEIRYTLTSTEIERILNKGGKLKYVHKAYIFKAEKIFEDFIDTFYKLRLEYKEKNDDIAQNVIKKIMNSCYGKFAEKNKNEILTPLVRDDFKFITEMKKRKEYIRKKIYKTNSKPEIAIFITAYARTYLQQLIDIAGEKNVFYYDTDSLIVNEKGFNNLKNYIDKKELGKLKHEYTINNAEFYAPKDYILYLENNIIKKMKGIKHNAIYNEKENTYEYKNIIKVKKRSKLIKTRNLSNIAAVFWEVIKKRVLRKYDKGIINDDNSTSPFTITKYPKISQTTINEVTKK